MAAGDITIFEEAKALILDGGWNPTDTIKCAILDNTATPTASTATPNISDFTQVGTGGTYVAGGTSLGTWADMVTESGGTVTIDSATNPSWAQHASNDTDAYWALVYNSVTGDALAFIDLGGPVDMSAGSLTVTWNASGLITLT